MFKFMKKGVSIGLIISVALSLSACNKPKTGEVVTDGVTSSETIKITKDQWMEDIDYMKENLEKKHKNLYHKITKEELEKQCDDLKKELDKLTDYQVKLRMAEIVASIGDAHTSLQVDLSGDGSVYPLGLQWFGEELKIFATDKEHKDLIGKTLIAINNTPIKEVMNKINKLIPHENQQWLKVLNVRYASMAHTLKELGVTKGEEDKFTLRADKGIENAVTINARNMEEKDWVTIKDSYKNMPVYSQYDEKDPNWKLYWYKYIPKDKIMYFQYNQCADRETARMGGYKDYEQLPSFDEFTNGLIKELKEKDVDKFVIDVRYNTGGNSMLMDQFVEKLSGVKNLKDKGKIFVITGRQTFSSGVLACTTLKKSTNAIFYGEPTGGNMNCYGDIKTILLPNSKIAVSYSTKYFQLDPNYKEGFVPDVVMEQSFDNYLKGIDETYEAIKKYGKE